MKKKILIAILTLGIVFSMSACNRQMIDLTYNYKYAIISLPNGEIVEGEVESWKDFDDGESSVSGLRGCRSMKLSKKGFYKREELIRDV